MKKLDDIVAEGEKITSKKLSLRARFDQGLDYLRRRRSARWILGLLLLLLGGVAAFAAAELRIGITKTGSTIEFKTTGEPGNRHILLKESKLEGITNALQTTNGLINKRIQTTLVDTNGFSTFTAKAPDTNTFFAVTDPPCPSRIVGEGTNSIMILMFPRDYIVTNTETAFFTIVAVNADTNNANSLVYQWYKNDVKLTDRTNSTLMITNAQFTTDPTSTNTDVGFYSCDVSTAVQPAVRIRSAEIDAPGARLWVWEDNPDIESDPIIHGPYQRPGGTAACCNGCCLGAYTGWLAFVDTTGNPWWYPPGGGRCTLTDSTSTVNIPGYQSKVYYHGADGTQGCDNTTKQFTYTDYKIPYQFQIYVINPILPTGTDLSLTVVWSR
jgi:hypothetical protein